MLTLTVKKKWFNMLISGEKREEYREIKSYYTKRFQKLVAPYYLDKDNFWDRMWLEECRLNWFSDKPFEVVFRNGYAPNAPSFVARVNLRIGEGNPEWGAEKDVEYYILNILEFTCLSNL